MNVQMENINRITNDRRECLKNEDYLENEALFKQLQLCPENKCVIEDKLARNNLNLVLSVANRYKYAPCEFDDLVAVGNLQLYRCITSYDVDSGVKFSTYAVGCIRKQLLSYIQSNMSMLHISEREARRMNAEGIKRKRESVDYENRDSFRTETDIPQISSINDENFAEVPTEEWKLRSFEDREFLDWFNIQLQNSLTVEEYDVIDACFGINTREPRTIKEISDCRCCSESLVRKIRDRAYKKLRENNELKAELQGFIAELRNRGL